MSNTIYRTGSDQWEHGEKLPGWNEWHKYLGPCPACGSRTFDYGGGWRCCDMYCHNSANNPIGNLGPSPDWWNTGIQVYMDGDAWCAVFPDFISPMESPQGFGTTPNEAAKELRALPDLQAKGKTIT